MTIKDKCNHYSMAIENLFLEWKQRKNDNGSIDHSNHTFNKDGVVCPETWFSSPIRPLFLLKESYDKNDSEGNKYKFANLIEHIHNIINHNVTPSPSLKNVSLWADGLLSTTEATIKPFSPHYKQKEITKVFKKIAIVNIKKSNGRPNSSYGNIKKYAEFDKEQLKREITLCDPTIIICGNTGYTLDTIFERDQNHSILSPKNDDWFYRITLNGHDVLILDYWHPAKRSPRIIKYNKLMEIYQKSLKKK